MVLVDTPVWSLALRRKAGDLSLSERRVTQSLYDLVQQRRVKLLGSTRQEVLSGIREESQFVRIRDHLRGFTDIALDAGDYEEAARESNHCRRSGIAGSPVDLLMCSVALRRGWQVFTTDHDFAHYRTVLGIQLYSESQNSPGH
jgi:predicted nucleic acid-binding protein